jgi:hypothetical protein
MKEILENRLVKINTYLTDAIEECNRESVYYYEGQKDIVESLLKEMIKSEFEWECYEGTLHSGDEQCNCPSYGYYGYDDAEYETNNPYYYFSDIDKYMLERRDLIEEQVENAHNTLHFTRFIGKSVINSDSYWFTSDEIEAFRVIWQRRISAM